MVNSIESLLGMGTSINDVPHFLVIFDLPAYLVLLYNVPFLGQFWTPLPTLKRDVINGRSPRQARTMTVPSFPSEHRI